MAANSDEAVFMVSTMAVWRAVSCDRGLMQSAAAVSGDSGRLVVGSRGSGWADVFGQAVAPSCSRRRHEAMKGFVSVRAKPDGVRCRARSPYAASRMASTRLVRRR